MHADENHMTVSLRALDQQSGISRMFVAVLSEEKTPSTDDFKLYDFSDKIEING